jgi:Domain of unknown function (DUF1737)
MKISEYKVLRGLSPEELQKAGNEHIRAGYQPFGILNVAVINEAKILCLQAVVKQQPAN